MQFLFTQIFNMIFDKLSNILLGISSISVSLFDQSVVVSLLNFFEYLGWIIMAIGILFAIANFCMSKTEGNDVPMDEMFKGIFLSIITVSFIRYGSIFVYTLADTIAKSIRDVASFNTVTINQMVNVLKSILSGYGILWSIIFAAIYIALLIIIFIQSIKRSGIYVMQIMVGYLYVFGIPAGNTEGILDWCRQTAALAATNVLQMAAVLVAINFMLSGNLFAAIGFLAAASSAEKVAGRFGMSVGSRQTIGGAIRGAGSVAQTVSTIGHFIPAA